ncbi:hypothetical protein HK101_010385 [Irineochytrium annulatum]|nr:hypothetical protein HK101_010385 [Irineochytrium annulatum]
MSITQTLIESFTKGIKDREASLLLREHAVSKRSGRRESDLLRREADLALRQQRFDAFWTNDASDLRPVVLRVGNRVFHTSRDVLLSYPDTFFSGLLSDRFGAARDPDAPKRFDTCDEGADGVGSEFYGLTALREELEAISEPAAVKMREDEMPGRPTGAGVLMLTHGVLLKPTGCWQWAKGEIDEDCYFMEWSEQSGDTVRILQGCYLITVRTYAMARLGMHGSMSLLKNGLAIARVYNCAGVAYSYNLCQVFELNEGDRMAVAQVSLGGLGDAEANAWSIVKIR